MQPHPRKPDLARHAPVLLTLLPLLPSLGVLALARLWALRELAPPVRTVLIVFVTTQMVAALLTPDVLVALGAALARSLLICALVALGAALPLGALRWLLIGLAGVQLTAIGVSAASWPQGSWPHDPGGARLWHPYVTSVTLGLGGALSVWLAAFAPGVPRGARLAAAALGLTTLLLSGSRGPLLALLVGLVAGMTVGGRLGGGRSRLRLAVLAAPLVALVLIVTAASTGPTARLLSADLNSRDLYWQDAGEVIRAAPLGGVGPYRLGPWLSSHADACRLWSGPGGEAPECPAPLRAWRGAWLVAHSTALHTLGESGVVGLLGFALLLGLVARGAWRARSALVRAVVFGTLAAATVDNPLGVPGLHVAEVFWLTGGLALRLAATTPPERPLTGAAARWGAGVLAALAWPALALAWPVPASAGRDAVRVRALVAPPIWPSPVGSASDVAGTGRYPLFVSLALPEAGARIQVRACPVRGGGGCSSVLKVVAGPSWQGWFDLPLNTGPLDPGLLGAAPGDVTLTIRVLSVRPAAWTVRPLGLVSWTVRR